LRAGVHLGVGHLTVGHGRLLLMRVLLLLLVLVLRGPPRGLRRTSAHRSTLLHASNERGRRGGKAAAVVSSRVWAAAAQRGAWDLKRTVAIFTNTPFLSPTRVSWFRGGGQKKKTLTAFPFQPTAFPFQPALGARVSSGCSRVRCVGRSSRRAAAGGAFTRGAGLGLGGGGYAQTKRCEPNEPLSA